MEMNRQEKNRTRRRAGFSLMEILLAIALMGIIMSVLVVGFGDVLGANEKKAAEMFVKHSVKPSLTRYRMDMGSYPSSAEGLAVLLNAPSGDKASRWSGPYVDELPNDPWGNPYQYACPGVHNTKGYDLWSQGQDLQSTEDDIGNW